MAPRVVAAAFAAALTILAAPPSALAQGGAACPPIPHPPVVRVDAVNAGVVYDLSQDARAISALFGRDPGFNMTVRGLTKAEMGVEVRATVSFMSNGQTHCAWPSRVEVVVGFSTPQRVYVDRNFPPGTCQHAAVREHEDMHVRINLEGLHRLAEILRDGLTRAVSDRGYPIRTHDREWARRAIGEAMSGYVMAVAAAEGAQRDARHAAIDTPESYRAMSARCLGW